MEGFANIAKQFIEFYYNQFDVDRKQLAVLYRDDSMLTFESTTVQGATAIVEKLSSLPFQKVRHAVSTLDAQPSGSEGGIIILVTGQLLKLTRGHMQVDEEDKTMSYSQTFQLKPCSPGPYYVFNDIFRLVFG
ncbi:Nuclear transport factor 2 [Golovinomyces cichoracearum]|uniref:NTF2-related export protein n=1 Tax=Golovinomyces cichoracearum TaxID=62708 RepID=A0A420IB89_9PEZI|nr:Nuclear transport factor 2 [Golovinomyces cichoracearum]